MSKEMFAPIEGYERYYEVSTLGRVRSLDRVIHTKSGKTVSIRGKILKHSAGKNGYPLVSLWKNNKQKMQYVHKVMATAFLVNPQCRRPEVDHINRVRNDNRLENLRWVSASVNHMNTTTRKDNKSGRNGVSFHKKACKWIASITFNGTQKHLGLFRTLKEAIDAREAAEIGISRYHPVV